MCEESPVMSSASTTLIYAELLSNIRQVSIIASFRTPSTASTVAELSDDRKLLKLIHDGCEGLLRLPAQVAAISKLQQPLLGSKEISWRLPLASPDKVIVAAHSTDTASAPWSAKRLSERSELHCKDCGNTLLTASNVQLWKDLPNENWAEMMDFWHCHKPDVPKNHKAENNQAHDHWEEKGYGANARFGARKGVGLVDLTYFLLSREDCKGVKLDPRWKKPSTSLISHHPLLCSDCNATIGAVDTLSDGYRLYKWGLSIFTPDSGQPSTYPLSNFLTAHLLSQISFQAVSKFILHSTDSISSSPSILYIWVFAPYLTVSFCLTGSDPSKPIPASKVFYRSITATEGNGILENASMSTEEVRLPTDVLAELLNTLAESTVRMPQSARKFREWDVGVLARFVEGMDE